MAKTSQDDNKLFGTNGIRGIFGKDLIIDLIVDLCYSLGTYFVEVPREGELEVQDIYNSKKFSIVDGFARDFIDQSIINSYVDVVLALVDVQNIRSHEFTVAIDVGNGAQATVAPLILRRLGCRVITINGNIDGNFPGRGPEPTN